MLSCRVLNPASMPCCTSAMLSGSASSAVSLSVICRQEQGQGGPQQVEAKLSPPPRCNGQPIAGLLCGAGAFACAQAHVQARRTQSSLRPAQPPCLLPLAVGGQDHVQCWAGRPGLASGGADPASQPGPTSSFTCAASVQLVFQYPWATSFCTAASAKLSRPAGSVAARRLRRRSAAQADTDRRVHQAAVVATTTRRSGE